ncbi:MAG: tetratricopeptide repeat protein [Candidatus Zixiibacteriota bacterium]
MGSKFCPNCGKPAPQAARFCPECGATVSGGKTGSGETRGVKSTGMRDLIIIVAALAIVAVGYFVFKDQPEPPAKPAEMPQAQAGGVSNPHQGMSMAMLDSLPQDFNTLVGMGNQFMDEGNYPIAAECYKRALAIDSTKPDVRVDYGACLHGMGLAERAVDEFRKALIYKPDHGIAHFNLGIVFRELNQNDSARIYWNKYLKIDPNGQAAEAARKFLKELGG